MGKRGDLSNFECGMVVGARRVSLSISQSAQLLGFSRTTILGFTKNGVKREEHPVWGSPVGKNALLMLEVEGEWADWFKLIEEQLWLKLTLVTTEVCSKAFVKPQHAQPWGGWATTPEDPTGYHSSPLQIGKRGYSLLNKIGQLKTGKMLPGLMSLDFCWDVNRMRTWMLCYHCAGWNLYIVLPIICMAG